MATPRDNIIWGIRSRSLPLHGILIDDTIPCTEDTYLAGYIAGYAHASDMAIALIDRYAPDPDAAAEEAHADAS